VRVIILYAWAFPESCAADDSGSEHLSSGGPIPDKYNQITQISLLLSFFEKH